MKKTKQNTHVWSFFLERKTQKCPMFLGSPVTKCHTWLDPKTNITHPHMPSPPASSHSPPQAAHSASAAAASGPGISVLTMLPRCNGGWHEPNEGPKHWQAVTVANQGQSLIDFPPWNMGQPIVVDQKHTWHTADASDIRLSPARGW